MSNINSDSEFYEGKVINNNTHYRMPRINYKRRRKPIYKGIINQQEPVKNVLPVLPFKQ